MDARQTNAIALPGIVDHHRALALLATGHSGAGVAAQQLLDRAERPADRVQRRRLAGGRCADQRLPQHQRLGPGRFYAGPYADAGKARDRCQQRLHDVIRRGAGATGGVAHPVAPRLRQDIERDGREGRTGVFQQARVDLRPAVRCSDGRRLGRARARISSALDLWGVVGLMEHVAEPRGLSVGISRTQRCARLSRRRDTIGDHIILSHRRGGARHSRLPTAGGSPNPNASKMLSEVA
jgi:hypothetical protein